MLFTLGLLLLLAPFPSFQTTTNEKRNSTGSDMTKPNAVFTLSKPKTSSTPAKQSIRPTLKPVTVNQTLLPTPATNQKPPTVNATVATKSKVSQGVIQTAAVKIHTASGTVINKDKHTVAVNQTVLAKLPSGSEVKANKDKPVPTGAANVHSASTKSASASSTKTTKDKPQPSVNQTISVKSPSTSDGKIAKDKPAPTIVQNVPSTSTKSAPATTTRNKPVASVNQTVVVKPSSTVELKTPKNKPVASLNQTVADKPPSTVEAKNFKDKPVASVNQTVVVKPPSTVELKKPKDKTVASLNQTFADKSPSTVEVKNSKDKPVASVNQTVADKPPSTVGVKIPKDKPVASVNQTVADKPPSTVGVKIPKDKPVVSVNQIVVKPHSTAEVKNPKDKLAANAVHTPLSTAAKAAAAAASGPAADKVKVTASPNQPTVIKAPNNNTTTTKEKPAPSQSLKVVISDGCDSNKANERELKVKPGTPLVMTHKISLMPGGCDGRCETELAALIGRVARLEKEMSQLKDNCPCSANCPNDCSGNGECEKGKCICHQGFVGPNCSKCAQGTDCNKKPTKGKAKETVEAVTLQKKDQKKETESKESDGKSKVTTIAKLAAVKTQAQQEVSVKKITTKGSPSVTKTSRPTVAQVLLKHEGRKQEEARKGKTVLASKKVLQKTDLKIVKVGTASKMHPKPDQLKDEPQTNATRANVKKFSVTAKIVTILSKGMGTNKTRAGKETLEQSTLADKNATQSPGPKRSKTIKVENLNVQSNRNNEAATEKVTQRSHYVVNATIAASTDEAQALLNKTAVHGPGMSKRVGGSGLGSVNIVNISSYSFTLTWLAPQGMFKNFSVIRREPRTEGDEDDHEDFEEEPLGLDKAFVAKNPAEVQVQTESTETAISSGKITGSRGKTETKRISMVVPGNVRSVEFSNLRANTRYSLYIYGTSAERRSKMHRVVAVTGPEPATEMVFSNVTESSLTVSWTKPKTTFTGFRVSYTNIITGERHFVVVDYQQSYIVLSKLSAGSSYIISVITTQGRSQSDALMSIITTVPAPPTHLQVANVTDTKALLQWTPSLGKVDRFIISYESSKTPNVTVTVMLSGNSVEHQLKGLQRGTLYRVKVLSQKDSLQSMAISTTFTTANVVKASEVGARSAVITWKTFAVVYHSYRVIYQVAGGETREVILDSTVTEYKLTGLLSMSRYIVLVQGERDGHYTPLVTTEFITGKLRFPFPTECSQELLNGALQSGEVDIYPQGKEGQAVRVYCDMETDGGGWTVFQRRMNGKTDFYRTWNEYRAGFGNLSEEFWLGNELLHNLTSIGPVSLRVDMKSGNETVYAQYANFSIDSEGRHYSLTVSGYSGSAGDSMRYHNGRPFSTWDKDADPLGIHCARAYMGAWWYKNCYKTNLNGLYGTNSNDQGVVWIDWKGKDSSIPFTEMKFRPSRFSPATHG